MNYFLLLKNFDSFHLCMLNSWFFTVAHKTSRSHWFETSNVSSWKAFQMNVSWQSKDLNICALYYYIYQKRDIACKHFGETNYKRKPKYEISSFVTFASQKIFFIPEVNIFQNISLIFFFLMFAIFENISRMDLIYWSRY